MLAARAGRRASAFVTQFQQSARISQRYCSTSTKKAPPAATEARATAPSQPTPPIPAAETVGPSVTATPGVPPPPAASADTFTSFTPGQYMYPEVTVLGVGGAGGNAVKNMMSHDLKGVRFVVANTDIQALGASPAHIKVQIGTKLTSGFGAGARPDVGQKAAQENLEDVMRALGKTSILFITAGMGGGTGTGASPVIAEAARKAEMLSVGVVSTPFDFEGKKRKEFAEEGVVELAKHVDTLMVVPNQNLLIANKRITLVDAFKEADDVLYRGVRGITDLVTIPGLVNVDFADIKHIMKNGGRAHMGIGEASGPGRAQEASLRALSNPLLASCDLTGATGALINVGGNLDLGLNEVDEIARQVQQQLSPDANIIFGSTFDPSLGTSIRVTLIVTGLQGDLSTQAKTPIPEPIPATPTTTTTTATIATTKVQPPAEPVAPQVKVEEVKEVKEVQAKQEEVAANQTKKEQVKQASGLWSFFMRHW